MTLTGEIQTTGRKTCPSASLSTTNPTRNNQAWTRTSAVREWWQTTWNMARSNGAPNSISPYTAPINNTANVTTIIYIGTADVFDVDNWRCNAVLLICRVIFFAQLLNITGALLVLQHTTLRGTASRYRKDRIWCSATESKVAANCPFTPVLHVRLPLTTAELLSRSGLLPPAHNQPHKEHVITSCTFHSALYCRQQVAPNCHRQACCHYGTNRGGTSTILVPVTG
jgi:hypothetical protein